jgi:plastocyanin
VNRRVLLMTISWVGALAGLTLLTLALAANTPVQAIMADSSVSVSVTESGFAPSVVTITVGTAVVWTNLTQETVHLVSGEPYRICLPLVLRNVSDTRVTATSPPMAGTGVTRRQGNWGNVDIAPGESYTHTFATAGNYPYFLAGHPDRTGLVVVQGAPPAPDFALGVQPLAQEVAQGESVTYTVAVTALHGFADSVVLDVGGVPAGTASSWTTNPLTPTDDTTLIITPSISSSTGTFTLVITGTGGGQVQTATATLSVVPHPDFVLGVQPSVQEVMQGESVTYTVAVTALYGFAEPIALTVGNIPAGTTVSWASNPLIPTADTTLTITPSMSTPTDTYALVITGTGGGLAHDTPFTLTVLSVSIMPQPGTWSCSAGPGITIRFTVSADSRSVSDGYVGISCGSNSIPGPVPIADDEFRLQNSEGHIDVAFDSDTHGQGNWLIFLSSSCWAMGTTHCSP